MAKKTKRKYVKKYPTPGMPKSVIDTKQVETLARMQCSLREIAAVVGCDEKTIRNRFHDLVESQRDVGRVGLRRKQYEIAMEGNTGMLVWLGKNELGQADKQENILSGDINIEIIKH